MAARLCPHCNIRSNFNKTGEGYGCWGSDPNRFTVTIGILQCQNCAGALIVVYRGSGGHSGGPPAGDVPKSSKAARLEEWLSYPAAVPIVDNAVPVNAANDFISGVNCLAISETKAAVTMFRRCLQQIMVEKGAKGSKLHDQIDDLAKRGIITNDLKEWADEIRFWGNEGAHPSSDGLESMSMNDCIAVKEFLESIFYYAYIMPSRVANSRVKRGDRKDLMPKQ